MRKVVILLLFLALGLSVQAQTSTQTNSDDEVLKIETSLVTIPVSVIDRSGRFVSDLQQSDFKVFEDGKEQEVGYFGTSEQPITVALTLDVSPSAELRIEAIQNAAIAFVNQLKPADKVIVIEFDSKVKVLSEATGDRAKIEKAIRKADFGNGTELYNAVKQISEREFKKVAGRKAIVMFTDGVDTGRKADANSSFTAAERAEAPVFVVYYDTQKDSETPLKPKDEFDAVGTSPEEYEQGRRYLQDLSMRTGGKVYNAEEGDLSVAFTGIAEELRRQYSVGFYPAEGGTIGQRKQIQVRVNSPDVIIRSRESYIVGEKENSNASKKKNDRKKSK